MTINLPNIRGKCKPEIKRHEAAQRGAAETGIRQVRESPVFAVDKGLEVFDDELGIGAGPAASASTVSHMRVLRHALWPGMVDSDDNQRLNLAVLNQLFGKLIEPPFIAREGRG